MIRSLANRAYYGAAWLALTLLERTAGKLSTPLASVCAYLGGLLSEKRYSEFDALLRHGIVKQLGKFNSAARAQRRPTGAGLEIDARTQRLNADGAIVAKPTVEFPSDAARVLVSVIIPCYNYGRFVEEALGSALDQTIGSCEVIVIDDGSTDETTRQVVERLSERRDIRVIRQANQGLPMARNNAIATARGEYICCLDADDIIAPTYLEVAIATMECDRSLGFAYSWVEFFGEVAEIWKTRDFDPEQALLGNFTSVSSVFRRDDWQAIGGYSATMRGGFEDWEFWLRLASAGRRGRVICHPLFRHRRHGRTMTHTAKDMQAELQARMRRLNPTYFASRPFRRRLTQLVPPHSSDKSLDKLVAADVASSDGRPGLLVVVAWLKRGGAEVLLLDILRSLARDWHIVIATTEPDQHDMSPDFAKVTREIYHLHGTFEREDSRTFIDYLIRARGVEVSLTSGSTWFLAALPELGPRFPQLKVAQLLHNHSADGPWRAGMRNERYIDSFIGVSSKIIKALRRQNIAVSKLAQIANGVDVEGRFAIDRVDRNAARLKFGLAPDQLALAWVGRLSPEKRPGSFLDIVGKLPPALNVKGMLVGQGEMAAAVGERSRAADVAGRVLLLQDVTRDAIAEVYAAADVLVLTSTMEGMPLVVLEALAMGCSVVATDVGDIARVVQPGMNGFLVDAGRPLSIADVIRENAESLMDDERRRKVAEDFRRSEFTQAKMVASYARLLGQLKSRAGAPSD